MNGGCLPMLGARSPPLRRENAGVKSLIVSTPASSTRTHARARARASARTSGRSSGFTLIEVMVALIVLVLGVLGAAAMTLTAIRDSKQSSLRSQASALAYELSDLIRASAYPTPAPPVVPPPPGTPPPPGPQEAVFTGAPPGKVAACWTGGCTPDEMAKNDYFEWNAKLTGPDGLPNGDAVICRDATNLASDVASYNPACDGLSTSPLVVKMSWDEKNNNARDATAPTAVTRTHLVVPIQPY